MNHRPHHVAATATNPGRHRAGIIALTAMAVFSVMLLLVNSAPVVRRRGRDGREEADDRAHPRRVG